MSLYKKNAETKVKPEQKYNNFISDLFIKSIESGTAPWTKPWTASEMNSIAPRNPETGSFYKGSNQLSLIMASCINGYNDPRWMTFAQIKAAGGAVKAGEHGVPLRVFIFEREVPVLDEKGKFVLDENGEKVTQKEEIDPPIISNFTVFNVKQTTFPPEHKYGQEFVSAVSEEQLWENLQVAESIIKNTQAQIVTGVDRAFYNPTKDFISLPPKESFKDQEGYYSTALHELSHWTGHPGRLDRDIKNSFGSQKYAREELVAEISSFMLCMNLGIGHKIEDHASYVESWLKSLKDDKNEILDATKKAFEAQKFISSFSKEQSLTEDRIYLSEISDKVEENEKLVELGAFYDIGKEQFYITKATHDLNKFIDYLPEELKKTVEIEQPSIQTTQNLEDENNKNKIENCMQALSKAINFINSQNPNLDSMTIEDKNVYIEQLDELIVQAESVKQLMKLESVMNLKVEENVQQENKNSIKRNKKQTLNKNVKNNKVALANRKQIFDSLRNDLKGDKNLAESNNLEHSNERNKEHSKSLKI